MSSSQPNEETLLENALGFRTAEEREAYLEGACPDAELRPLGVAIVIWSANDQLPSRTSASRVTVNEQQ